MYQFDLSSFYENGIACVGEFNPYITLACDLRCRYCYMFDYLAKAKNVEELMNPAFLIGMAEFLCEQGGGLDRATLLGGEPTLHPDITLICNEYADLPICERRMTTNGIGTHWLKLEDLKPGVFDHVSISIDGITAAVNDPTRGTGTFEKIIHTIGLYRQAGVPLSINYTVTTKNIDHLNETLGFFADLGVSIVNFHRASQDGNAHNNQDILVDAAAWVEARDRLFAYIAAHGGRYPDLKVRIPYTFLTQEQLGVLGYKPIQEQNYHSPDGGHRLIVFPPTAKGQGLCYMSSDMIGVENAELGRVNAEGVFVWNDHPRNEMVAFQTAPSANVSTDIKGQTEGVEGSGLIRVSHSFKMEGYLRDLVAAPAPRPGAGRGRHFV